MYYIKAIRCISVILCFVFLVNLFSPIALASENNAFPEMYITAIDDYANCFYQSDAYIASAVIETNTGYGCFAILYNDSAEYIYEYYFTLAPNEIYIKSSSFWNSLLSQCMSNQEQWRELYKPVIVYSNTANVSRSTRSSDITTKFAPALEEQLDTTEYSGRIIHTDSRDRYLFHIYENVEFNAVEKELYFIPNAMSVAAFITSVLQMKVTSTLLSVFSFVYGLTIPAETEIGSHNVCAITQRYVKRMDSSIWLNSTCRVVYYDGYAIANLDYYAIDTGSESVTYTHSEAYFNDKNAQIDDAYYYLTHN